jgi:microcystin-dependent protein
MGGSAASRLTSGTSGITGTTLGAGGGDERVHQHSHTFTGSAGTTGNDNADHTHAYQTVYNTSAMMAAGSSYYVYYPTTTSTGGRSSFHQHSFTPSGTNSNFGAGSSQNVQPTLVLNYIIRAQ